MSFHQFVLNDSSLTLGNALIEQIINIMARQCSDEALSAYLKKMNFHLAEDEGADKTNGGHFYSLKMYNDTIIAAAYYHPTQKHTVSIQLNDNMETCIAEPKQWAVVWGQQMTSSYKTSWKCEV